MNIFATEPSPVTATSSLKPTPLGQNSTATSCEMGSSMMSARRWRRVELRYAIRRDAIVDKGLIYSDMEF